MPAELQPDALYLQSIGGECRAFRYREGLLDELAIWHPGQPFVGDCYRARVTRIVPALGLAFCDLGVGPKGVLPLEQAPKDLTEGRALPLRMVRAAAPGKGPKLAPARGPKEWHEGEVPRRLVAAAKPLERFLKPEPSLILVDRPEARDLLTADQPVRISPAGFPLALTNHLEAEVEALLTPRVELSGGSLLIEPGETLTAIDVNQGTAGRGLAERARADFNHQVLDEVARQLRLRSLAGRILIDCLSLESRQERDRLKAAMRQALADDPERVEVKGMTVTGLLEITRRRGHFSPLHEALTENALLGGRRLSLRAEAACLLRQLAAMRRDQPAERLRLKVGEPLLAVLSANASWSALTESSGSLLQVLPFQEPDSRRFRIETV